MPLITVETIYKIYYIYSDNLKKHKKSAKRLGHAKLLLTFTFTLLTIFITSIINY